MTREQMDREIGYLDEQIEGFVLEFPHLRRISDDEAAEIWRARAAELHKQRTFRKAIILACLGILGGMFAGIGAVLFSMWMGWA